MVQEEHHSDQSVHESGPVEENSPAAVEGQSVEDKSHSQRKRVKWPAAADKKA